MWNKRPVPELKQRSREEPRFITDLSPFRILIPRFVKIITHRLGKSIVCATLLSDVFGIAPCSSAAADARCIWRLLCKIVAKAPRCLDIRRRVEA